jgi:minor extracellular serine protease Vpr
MKNNLKKLFNILAVIVMLQATVFSAFAANPKPPRPVDAPPVPDGTLPMGQKIGLTNADRVHAAQLKLSGLPIDTLDASLIPVSIRGSMPSLSEKAKALSESERLAYKAQVDAFQAELEKSIVAEGGNVIYRYRTLSSGVIAEVPGNRIMQLAQLPAVQHISRIFDFQVDLAETVPFIGATALKELGIKGDGVKVAVLDSGIDYTHLAFGGSADPALWEEAYFGSDPACLTGQEPQCAANQAVAPEFADLFGPGAPKVKGGFDWVGPVWPNGPLMPDPNPIALAGTGYHGTHVADIIAGFGYPAGSYTPAGSDTPVPYAAKGEGVAPGADLYSFTVCSMVSSSCAGVSLLQAMDDAADLDDNPATIDPADVLNMSLGSLYGQPEDDLTYLTNQVVAYGTIVAAAAGNDADHPFIVSSPSIASGAISVAQTEVPSAKQYRIVVNSPSAIAGDLDAPVIHSWSAQFYTSAITADIVYDGTSTATKLGCNGAAGAMPTEWAGNPTLFSGKIVLVDRGSCAASFKVANAQAAGASMVLVAMIAPGPGYPFAYGGGTVSIPSFSITQADGNKLKSTVPSPITQLVTLANATADPSVYLSLANTIVQTSARGPRNHDNKIKPDIGAPGASVSAEAGTGAGSTGFGGTSGATPMVAGSAALLKSLFGDQGNFVDPQLTVQEYKGLLMNTANNKIYENRTPSNLTGDLLPITRIGAGQVDLEHTLKNQLIALDVTDASLLEHTGSMSFQYVPATDVTSVTRKLHIRNLSGLTKFVDFTSEFRYASDDTGAVTVKPSVTSATIPANGAIDVNVTVTVDPSKLTPWYDPNDGWLVDRGYFGGNGPQFKLAEYDGYFYVNEVLGGSVTNSISIPWQVLPKPAADVTMAKDPEADSLTLTNASPAVTSNADLFMLVDANPNDYHYVIGDCSSVGNNPGCNQSPVDLKEVGVRGYVLPPMAGPQDTNADYAYIDFGITIWDYPFRSGPMVPEFDIYVDSTGDGNPDFVVFNGDYGYTTAGTFSGQQVVFIYNLTTGGLGVRYYLDSTFDSNNFILPVKASDLGLSQTNLKFKFFVLAFDFYFGGPAWDASPQQWDYHQVDLLNPRWSPETLALTVAPDSSADVAYTVNGPGSWVDSGSQIGFLAMYREAPVQQESSHVLLTDMPRVTNVNFIPIVSAGP